MKGTIYPRPHQIDPETGEKRPVRGSTWTYQFSVLEGGKRRHLSKGGHRTKKDAEAALRAAIAEHESGERVEPSKMTVAEWLSEEWFPSVSATLKPTTARGYELAVDRWLVPHLGQLRLSEVTPGRISECYETLRTSGRRNGNGLSEQSVKNAHTVLHRALEEARRRRLIARNPAADVDRPKPRRTEMKTWSADQARAFVAGIAGERLEALWTLALTTGLRRGELLGLRWDDVDLDGGRLAVRRARVAAGYDVHEGAPKSGKARTVALDSSTVVVLRRHRKNQLEERMAWGEAWTDTGAVFTREEGTSLHPHTVAWHWKRLMRSAEVPAIRFHDLRHTHATLALAADVHPKVVQERLGHSSISITLDTYSHVAPSMQAEAAEKIGGLVFGSS